MHTVDEVNVSRRRFLTNSASVVGAVGGVFVAVPFLASWSPSERARAAGAPIVADISKLEPGAMEVFEWRGKPVWVVDRTPTMLETLATDTDVLQDPDSENSIQPEYAQNQTRSRKPEILVMLGVCTHLGCSPKFRPDTSPEDLGPSWMGGFFCPCHGSKFDLAGRVFKGVPAPTNMTVPPHMYLSDTEILVGDDSGGEAS